LVGVILGVCVSWVVPCGSVFLPWGFRAFVMCSLLVSLSLFPLSLLVGLLVGTAGGA